MAELALDTLLENPGAGGIAAARRVIGFVRSLRDNGFAIGLAEARDALRATAALDLSSPGPLRLALKPLLATRRDEAQRFEDLFNAYWLRRGVKTATASPGNAPGEQPAKRSPTQGNLPGRLAAFADRVSRDAGEEADAAGNELRRGGASRAENLARTDFRHLDDPASAAMVEDLAERMALALRRRLVRRRKAARRGDRLDLRRMLHASIAHGGEPIEIFRKRARRRPLRPVLLLDASGSMAQYSGMFLRFMLALLKRLPEGEGYLFHTRLVEIGPILRERRRVKALERLSLLAEGWGGGTRIGECLASFVKHHAKRALRGRAALFILSDGYDTGEPAQLAKAMAALKQRTRRIIWLNPLLGWRDYQPIAGGMAAALPYIDVFAPAHNLESLAALEPHLARA
jgi:uncharacterized protein with von Willebrand factor type A (vWA) domain